MIVGNRERDTAPTTFVIKVVEPVGGAVDASVIEQLQTQLDALTQKAASTTAGPTVRDVENLKSQIDALVFQMNDAVGRLGTRVVSVETVNTTQNTKITALEANGAGAAAVYGVADTAWINCTRAAATTKTIQVRVWKGRVIFQTNGGTVTTSNLANPAVFTAIATLPASIPKPPAEFYSTVSTWQLPAAGGRYAAGVLHIRDTDGVIRVAPGPVSMDGFDIAGISYPVGAY